MASILIGVAVIPAQAARLFEALLEFQEERRQTIDAKNNKFDQNASKDGDSFKKIDNEMKVFLKDRYDKGDILDSRISCRSCGVRCHRIDAIYCFSCGERL